MDVLVPKVGEIIGASLSSEIAKASFQYSSVNPSSRPKVSRSRGVSPKLNSAITKIGISMYAAATTA